MMPLKLSYRPVFSLVLIFMLLISVGCSGGSDLTGKVTVDGIEVNVGTLYLNPDLDAGNDGPSVYADVKDGTFSTNPGGKVTPGKNKASLTVSTLWLKSKGQETDAGVGEDENVPTTNLKQSFDIPDDGPFDFKFVTE